jgi:predicted ATP-grasp superfamily ATP-dependent carboligase
LQDARRYHACVNVFVYEHMNGGACADVLGRESLRTEGLAMLVAVLEDLQACPGIDTVTLVDRPRPLPGRVVVASGFEAGAAFRDLARSAERSLVIAPETDGVLESRCRMVEEIGGCLLGPSSTSVRLAADKLVLAAHLSARAICTPPTKPLTEGIACPFPFPVVVKPRDGAGSEATALIKTRNEWCRHVAERTAQGLIANTVVQPFVPGRAVSVALLVGPGRVVPLPAAAQHLSTDGRFTYLGGALPLALAENERAQELAVRAVATVPGLRGFVGVDLVLGECGDGRSDAVIEINPRLTTSYVGLRVLAGFNLPAAIVAACDKEPLPEFVWKSGPVDWRADGQVEC